MQRTKTLAYDSKVPASGADKPDSVAPVSGIRLVRPPLATLPGASSVPPQGRPSRAPASGPMPTMRSALQTLPLALAPAAPRSVPPPPPSGPRARVASTLPPPSRRPPRPAPATFLDEDAIVADDVEPLAEVTAEDVTSDAVEIPTRPRGSLPQALPSLRATGQNWPQVQWPRLDATSRTPRPASVRPSAPPRPSSRPASTPASVPAAHEDLGGTMHGREAEARELDALEATATSMPDAAPSDAPTVAREAQMIPPPPALPTSFEAERGDVAPPSAIVTYDDDVVDFAPTSPLARLRAAAQQVGPILAWLDQNPRAFASVGFGAGVVVALFVALVVQ